MTTLLLFGTLLFGCQDNSPEAVEARQWAGDLEPLLHENSLLAEQVLETAADLYNAEGKADELVPRWTDKVVPTAQHLQHQSELVKPPTRWKDRHDSLVATWTARAEAYEGVLVGIETGDKELWGRARKMSDEAKLAEEKWFQVVNTELEPYDVVLDQFP